MSTLPIADPELRRLLSMQGPGGPFAPFQLEQPGSGAPPSAGVSLPPVIPGIVPLPAPELAPLIGGTGAVAAGGPSRGFLPSPRQPAPVPKVEPFRMPEVSYHPTKRGARMATIAGAIEGARQAFQAGAARRQEERAREGLALTDTYNKLVAAGRVEDADALLSNPRHLRAIEAHLGYRLPREKGGEPAAKRGVGRVLGDVLRSAMGVPREPEAGGRVDVRALPPMTPQESAEMARAKQEAAELGYLAARPEIIAQKYGQQMTPVQREQAAAAMKQRLAALQPALRKQGLRVDLDTGAVESIPREEMTEVELQRLESAEALEELRRAQAERAAAAKANDAKRVAQADARIEQAAKRLGFQQSRAGESAEQTVAFNKSLLVVSGAVRKRLKSSPTLSPADALQDVMEQHGAALAEQGVDLARLQREVLRAFPAKKPETDLFGGTPRRR